VVVSLREITTLQSLATEVLVAGQTAQTLEQPWRLCKAGMVARAFLQMLVVVVAAHRLLEGTELQALQGMVALGHSASCRLCLLISAVVAVVE
jgi:hypothetical protein